MSYRYTSIMLFSGAERFLRYLRRNWQPLIVPTTSQMGDVKTTIGRKKETDIKTMVHPLHTKRRDFQVRSRLKLLDLPIFFFRASNCVLETALSTVCLQAGHTLKKERNYCLIQNQEQSKTSAPSTTSLNQWQKNTLYPTEVADFGKGISCVI